MGNTISFLMSLPLEAQMLIWGIPAILQSTLTWRYSVQALIYAKTQTARLATLVRLTDEQQMKNFPGEEFSIASIKISSEEERNEISRKISKQTSALRSDERAAKALVDDTKEQTNKVGLAKALVERLKGAESDMKTAISALEEHKGRNESTTQSTPANTPDAGETQNARRSPPPGRVPPRIRTRIHRTTNKPRGGRPRNS